MELKLDKKIKNQVDTYVEVYKSLLKNREITYISAPITTGKNYLKWFQANSKKYKVGSVKYKQSHLAHVITPNSQKAKEVVRGFSKKSEFVVDPTSIDIEGWGQSEYYYFWGRIIEDCISTIVFVNGWEYSKGCCYEFYLAKKKNIATISENYNTISLNEGKIAMKNSIAEYENFNIPSNFIIDLFNDLIKLNEPRATFKIQGAKDLHYKDSNLSKLAKYGNIAQFISFEPGKMNQRYSAINGFKKDQQFSSAEEAIKILLHNSTEKSVNVRSFSPENPKGQPFYYGLKNIADALDKLKHNASEDLYSIINETVDINDGGVSGVVFGDIIEFAPNDTPKSVDKPGICSLPRALGIKLLETIYGFKPELKKYPQTARVEFSIHPKKRGVNKSHTIIWEIEDVGTIMTQAILEWPNKFSSFIGDKAFGLILADLYGFKVPYSTLISKNVAPFSFGTTTGTAEIWFRTCPSRRTPGKYPTYFGWHDPFEVIQLLRQEKNDTNYTEVVSILSQESVYADYSGSLLPTVNGPLIEGVAGKGDEFMLGEKGPQELPDKVIQSIKQLYFELEKKIGAVEIEWVYDGKDVWIVQLHQVKEKFESSSHIIYPGNVKEYRLFEVRDGLVKLKETISNLTDSEGIALVGDVGVTSHFGDALRSNKIPSYLKKSDFVLNTDEKKK